MTVFNPLLARHGIAGHTPPVLAAVGFSDNRTSIRMTESMTPSRDLRFGIAFVASLGMLAFSGCDDGTGLGKRYSVSGMVAYKGEPVKSATISFVPTSPEGRSASGQVEDGNYSLTTLAPNDGALPGKYKVTIISKSIDTTELQAIAKGGQFHHDKAFAKASKNAKALVPSKYTLPETSGLEGVVKEQSNKIDFELKD